MPPGTGRIRVQVPALPPARTRRPGSRGAGPRAAGSRRRASRSIRGSSAGRRHTATTGMPASRVQPRVGVEPDADSRQRLAEYALAVPLQQRDELLVPRARRQRAREQQPPDVDADAGLAGRALDQRAQVRFDRGRVLLGDHPAVELQHDLVRHDIGVDPAVDAPDDERRASRCPASPT